MVIRSFTYEGFDGGAAFTPFEVVSDIPSSGEAVVVAEEPKNVPIFTAEDMEIAKTVAKADGIREGFEQARAEILGEKAQQDEAIKLQTIELLEKVSAQIESLNAAGEQNKGRFSERLASLALALASKVCGDVSDKVIENEITAIINDSIGKLEASDKVKIFLNPENARNLNDKFTNAVVNTDEKMQKGDFRIEWNNGFAERDVKKLWKSISEICSRHSSLEENDEPETNNEQPVNTNNKIEE